MADKAGVNAEKSVQERLLDDLSSAPKRGRPRGGSDGGLDGQSPQKGAKRSCSGGRVRSTGKDLSAMDGLVGAAGAGAQALPAASSLSVPSTRHFAGLSNQGATCYMNSLLQTLFMTPDFRDLMFRWRYSRSVDGPPDISIFGGQLEEYVRCDECGNTRRRFADFQDLSLDVVPFGAERAFASIGESLASYCAPEVMDGSNKVQCDVCGRQTRTVKGSRVSKWPQYLVLQLKRFTIDMLSPTLQRVKLQDPVAFPFSLDARRLMTEAEEGRAAEAARIGGADGPVGAPPPAPSAGADDGAEGSAAPAADVPSGDGASGAAAGASGTDSGAAASAGSATRKPPPPPPRNHAVTPSPPPGQFELFAVLVHSGGALGGHYYAYVKDLESCRWFNFNDSSVTSIDEATVRSAYGTGKASYGASAYMLVYREVPDTERRPEPAAEPTAAEPTAADARAGGASDGTKEGGKTAPVDASALLGSLAATGSASAPSPATAVLRRSLFPDTALLPPGLLRALESIEAEETKAEEERERLARLARVSVHSFADESTVTEVWIDREDGTVGELIRRALVGLGAVPEAPPAAADAADATDTAAAVEADSQEHADGEGRMADAAPTEPKEADGFLYIGGGGSGSAAAAGSADAAAAADGAGADESDALGTTEHDATVHWGMWRGIDLRLFRLRRYDTHAKLAREAFPDNSAALSRAHIYSYAHTVLERRASVREEWEEYNPLHVGLRVRQWSEEKGDCVAARTLRVSRSSSLGNLRGRVSEMTGIPPDHLRLLRCDAGIGSEPRAFELVGDVYPISRMGITSNVTIFAEDLRCASVQKAIAEAQTAFEASLLALDDADAPPQGGGSSSAMALPASYGAAVPRDVTDHTESADATSTDDEESAADDVIEAGQDDEPTPTTSKPSSTPAESPAATPSASSSSNSNAGGGGSEGAGDGVKIPPKGHGSGVTLLAPRARTSTTPGTTRSGLPVHDTMARRPKASKLHQASKGSAATPATSVVSGAASRGEAPAAHVSTAAHPGPGGRGGDTPDAPAVSQVFTMPSDCGAVPVRLDASPCVGVYERELNIITVRVPLVLGEGKAPLPGRVSIDRRISQLAFKEAIASHFGRDSIDGLVFRQHSATGKILVSRLDNSRTVRDALIYDGNNIFVEEGSEAIADLVEVPVTVWRPSFPLGTDWAGPPEVLAYEEAMSRIAPEGAPVRPCAPHFAPELPTPQEAEWARLEVSRISNRSAAVARQQKRDDKAKAAADKAAADKVGVEAPTDGKEAADLEATASKPATGDAASAGDSAAAGTLAAGSKPTADAAAGAGDEAELDDPALIADDAALIADEWGPLGVPRNIEPHPDIGPASCVEAGLVKLALGMSDTMVREVVGDRLRAIGALDPALQVVADQQHGAASSADATVPWLPRSCEADWAKHAVSVFSQRILFAEAFANRTLRYNTSLSSMAAYLSSYTNLLATPRRSCDFGNDALMALPEEPQSALDHKFESVFVRWVDRTRMRLLPPRQVVISRDSHVMELGLRLERVCGIPARYLQFSNAGTFLGLHNMDSLTWWRFTDKYRMAKMWADTTCIVVTTTDDCSAFPPRFAPMSVMKQFDPYLMRSEGGSGSGSAASSSSGSAAATAASVRTSRPRQLDRGIKIQTHQQRQRDAAPASEGAAAAAAAAGADGSDPAAAAAALAAAAAAEEEAVYGLGEAEWSGASTAVSRPAAAIATAAAASAQERDLAKEDATRQRLRDEEAERDATGGEEEVDGDVIPLDDDGQFDPWAMMGV